MQFYHSVIVRKKSLRPVTQETPCMMLKCTCRTQCPAALLVGMFVGNV